MRRETYERLKAANKDLYLILCDPEIQQNDFIEHILYSVVRLLNQLLNRLEAMDAHSDSTDKA